MRGIVRLVKNVLNKDAYWHGEFRSVKFEGKKMYLEWYSGETETIHLEKIVWQEIALDPNFWRCLGKALGWGKDTYDYERGEDTDWKWHWHRFIDALSEGKTADDFFGELLK